MMEQDIFENAVPFIKSMFFTSIRRCSTCFELSLVAIEFFGCSAEFLQQSETTDNKRHRVHGSFF